MTFLIGGDFSGQKVPELESGLVEETLTCRVESNSLPQYYNRVAFEFDENIKFFYLIEDGKKEDFMETVKAYWDQVKPEVDGKTK